MQLKISLIAAILITIAGMVSGQAVTFIQTPSMVASGSNQWTISFEISRNADVEVSIVNLQDSTVVRHLAAGVLGAKAPQPFAINALSQSIIWDGKDDFGKSVANPENFTVRVRAGMTPRLANFAGENLYDNPGSPSIAADGHGGVYILSNVSYQCPFLRKYDAAGNYIKTLYPPPANLPADSVASYRVNILPGGGWVPKTYPSVGHSVIFTSLVLRNATIGFSGGVIRVFSGTSGQHIIDTNGCFTDNAPNAMTLAKTVSKPVINGALVGLTEKSTKTGSVYAITDDRLHPTLAKYTGSKVSPTLLTSVSLFPSASTPTDSIISMAVAENGSTTNIFVGFKTSGVRIYSDNGTALKLTKVLGSEFRDGPFVFERLAVDRNNESVFWNGGYSNGANMIADWKNPVSTNIQVRLDNISVSQDGRFLYGWNGADWTAYAKVKRFSRTSFAGVPFGNTGNNSATGDFEFQYGAAGTPGNHRGMAVGWKGKIAAFTEGSYLVEVPDSGGSVTCGIWEAAPVGDHRKLISCDPAADKNFAREGMMGVKYDPAGNYYVGLRKWPVGGIVPAGFSQDPAFKCSGAIVKFHPDSTAIFNPVNGALTGYTKIYKQPFGPFTLPANGADQIIGGSQACTCRSSYFDVDPYGRLFVPNGVTCQIYVADNAGNNISVFGQYGNTDSRGRLSGPGELLFSPDIPLAWPTSVGASEDFVYVSDLVNARLVRVQMVYDVDNHPGLTLRGYTGVDRVYSSSKLGIKMAIAPNPFNPISNISFDLKVASRVTLAVYDVNGRLVKTIAAGNFDSGAHRFFWNAKNEAGQEVSAGMYVYKLVAGKQTVTQRTVFAK